MLESIKSSYLEQSHIDYIGVLKYLEENNETPFFDPETVDASSEKQRFIILEEKGQYVTAELEKMLALCHQKLGLKQFSSIPWLNNKKTKTKKYLCAQMKYADKQDSPSSISIFVEMRSANKAAYRVSLDIDDEADNAEMEQYHSHLDLPLNYEAGLVYVSGSNALGRPEQLDDSQDIIIEKVKSGKLRKVQISAYIDQNPEHNNEYFEKSLLLAVKSLIPYYNHVVEKENDDDYWPRLDEYVPGINKDEWLHLLQDSDVTIHENLVMFKMMLIQGGESTCANLAETYGESAAYYNSCGRAFAQRVYKKTDCPLCADGEHERIFTIPFRGRHVSENGKNRYSWKLRDELKEALEEMDLRDINVYTSEIPVFDNNMILYGPPGTGKTYNSAIYAVSICDGKTIDEVRGWDYDEVMARYHELQDDGRVAFTTFHQSYGYEEFIEGIKPVLGNTSGEIGYKCEDGVFKAFCNAARKKEVSVSFIEDGIEGDFSPNVWSILLDGTGTTKLKEECFAEGTVRIGWADYPEIITSDTEGLSDNALGMLLDFQDEIKIGDFIVTCANLKTIDAIGVVTGICEYDDNNKKFPRKRNVKWLATGLEIDVPAINGGKQLNRNTVCNVPRISGDTLLRYIETDSIVIDDTAKNYVFIIDEINRGNISKIFGELITLIEDTKRDGSKECIPAVLPYSGEKFTVPQNVYILGTMNTADRSIALMDTALRRRFHFVEMMPDSDVLRDIGADRIHELDVAEMLDKINERISFLYDREHTIGHAFFTKLKDSPNIETLATIFQKSIIPLLQEYFYEDYHKIQLVLGDNGKIDPDHKFILDEDVHVTTIFKGRADDVDDLPEKKYKINQKAFMNLDSYKEII